MQHRKGRRRSSRLALPRHACLIASLLLAGCAQPGPSARNAPQTGSDALTAHYPDLQSGRFAVLADFEDLSHATLFRVIESDGSSADPTTDNVWLAPGKGVPATGGTCLNVTFTDDRSVLIADNEDAEGWTLQPDWRPYSLLMMNVFCPVDALQLELVLVSDDGEGAAEAHSRVPLVEGWNLLRLDLGEAANYITLNDVSAMTFSIPDLDRPVQLRFDDILLADNETPLFGNADAESGSLYVVRQGRRIRVGAVDRFELGFANGQIVSWYATEEDPLRLRNLVGGGNVLGPLPVVLPDDDAIESEESIRWPAGFSSLGDMVVTRQRVVEANPVRVVVEGEWRFKGGADTEGLESPFHRWIYTIYPSGHVFVSLACATEAEGFFPEHLGLIVSRAADREMLTGAHEPGQLRDAPELQHVSYGWIAASRDEAGLLYVLHDSRKGPRMRAVKAMGEPRTTMIAFGGYVDHPRHEWHCVLSVWPSGNCAPERREEIVVSYTQAPPMEFLVGGLELESPGDEDGDGFNELLGTYMLQPDSNRVQFRLDGSSSDIVSPAFAIHAPPDREAWVYLDYVIHEPVARTADDLLVFQVPGVIEGERIVEVYLRSP